MNQHHLPQHRARGTRWYFFGFLAIAGYFLFAEHRAHVLPYLPFLLVLACPLMHFFMHRGHGRYAQGQSAEHDNCGGHQHTSARNGPVGHDGLPDHQTKSPDRPA